VFVGQLLHHAHLDRPHQLFLADEVAVDCADRDIGPVADVLQREVFVATFFKQRVADIEDAGDSDAAPVLLRPLSNGRLGG
jgi:hypothetical protein